MRFKPAQIAATIGQRHAKAGLARRLPLHRQQAFEPFVDLRHRLPAITNQCPAVVRHPVPHVVESLLAEKRFRIAAQHQHLKRAENLRFREHLGAILDHAPRLRDGQRLRWSGRRWFAVVVLLLVRGIRFHRRAGDVPFARLLLGDSSLEGPFEVSVLRHADHADEFDGRIGSKRPRQKLRVPIRLPFDEQHADRFIDHAQQEGAVVVDPRHFPLERFDANFIPIQPARLLLHLKSHFGLRVSRNEHRLPTDLLTVVFEYHRHRFRRTTASPHKRGDRHVLTDESQLLRRVQSQREVMTFGIAAKRLREDRRIDRSRESHRRQHLRSPAPRVVIAVAQQQHRLPRRSVRFDAGSNRVGHVRDEAARNLPLQFLHARRQQVLGKRRRVNLEPVRELRRTRLRNLRRRLIARATVRHVGRRHAGRIIHEDRQPRFPLRRWNPFVPGRIEQNSQQQPDAGGHHADDQRPTSPRNPPRSQPRIPTQQPDRGHGQRQPEGEGDQRFGGEGHCLRVVEIGEIRIAE